MLELMGLESGSGFADAGAVAREPIGPGARVTCPALPDLTKEIDSELLPSRMISTVSGRGPGAKSATVRCAAIGCACACISGIGGAPLVRRRSLMLAPEVETTLLSL